MKALILGGGGFYGSHVVDKFLDENWEVIVVDSLSMGNKICEAAKRKIEFVERSAEESNLLNQLATEADCIINLASVVGVDVVTENELRQMDNEVNIIKASVQASLNNRKIPIIYTSSSSVYGSMNQGIAAKESMPIAGCSSYSIAKAWGEKYYKCFSEKENVHVSVVRPFNLYGPRQDTRMVIPRFIEAAIKGNKLCVYGDGTQTRDFTYVKDGAEALYRLAVSAVESISAPYQELNCCTGKETTIGELARVICETVDNSASEIIFKDVPIARKDYEVARRFGDNSLFKKLTGINSITSLPEGLKECIKFSESQEESFPQQRVG